MRTRRRTVQVAAALWLAAAYVGRAGALEKPEELVVLKLPPLHAHSVFIVDMSLSSMTDGRIYLYDADACKLLGQIDADFGPGFAVVPDRRASVVATTYFRAARTASVPTSSRSPTTRRSITRARS